MRTILPWLVMLAVAALVVWLQRVYLKTMLKRLGDGATAVPLYHRPSIIAQRVLFGVALGFPIVVIAFQLMTDVPFDVVSAMRSAWLGVAVWGWQQGSVVMAGPKGLAMRGHVFAWPGVDPRFDRDIGQRQWGLTLTLRNGKREERRRLFVAREMKEELERVLREYAA